MRRAVLFFLVAISVSAQTANVIELDPQDSIRAQKAWNALQKAQTEWDKTRSDIDDKYVNIGPEGVVLNLKTGRGYQQPLPGFSYGFEFSRDFKHIVPKPVTVSARCV